MTDSMTLSAADNPIQVYWQMIESGDVVVSEKVRKVYRKLIFDLNNQEDRTRFDNLVHYWMVLIGYGARLEDGRESIDMCPGHDASELKNHRDFYYGAIHSDRSEDHMEIYFFSKHTNWEVGRF